MEEIKGKLTNEEIAKVFAMYWGQKVFCWNKECHAHQESPLGRLDYVNSKIDKYCKSGKLFLAPLSSITDEHAIEISKMLLLGQGGEMAQYKRLIKAYLKKCLLPFAAYTQLVLWGYDIELFFGLNHWANGKTAIELGIAIEKAGLQQEELHRAGLDY